MSVDTSHETNQAAVGHVTRNMLCLQRRRTQPTQRSTTGQKGSRLRASTMALVMIHDLRAVGHSGVSLCRTFCTVMVRHQLCGTHVRARHAHCSVQYYSLVALYVRFNACPESCARWDPWMAEPQDPHCLRGADSATAEPRPSLTQMAAPAEKNHYYPNPTSTPAVSIPLRVFL